MFGLGKQVHGNPVGIGFPIADNQYLGGTGHHVDANLAKYQSLCRRHVDIARANNLVYPRNALCTIGQGCYRLGTANREYTISTGNRRRRQHQVTDFTPGAGNRHNNFIDSGHLCRDYVHQHGGRVTRLATGHVDTDALQRSNLLAQQRPGTVPVLPGFL